MSIDPGARRPALAKHRLAASQTPLFEEGSKVQPNAGPAGAEPFVLEVDSLNTSDLNRDGHPDLIASDGRLLIAAAPRANRAPIVNAARMCATRARTLSS